MLYSVFYIDSSLICCLFLQGELEHRSPKARYRRTDRKDFIRQLTQIERRQACLCQIKQQTSKIKLPTNPHQPREMAASPEQHHHIGKNENMYEELGGFLRKHQNDPAVTVRTEYVIIWPHYQPLL